jgi:hypothetical protein
MKYALIILLSLCVSGYAVTISQEQRREIAQKIWENECGGSQEGLTSWNKGENCASLGIGHFIWYPENKKEGFEETFPALLLFLKKHNVSLPPWLSKAKSCPWNSKEAFDKSKQGVEMSALRQLLVETQGLQALFIAERLEKSFPHIASCLNEKKRASVIATFNKLSATSKGLFALIDYLNFKGKGTSLAERYKGEGWGLLQVLEKIPPDSSDPLVDFVAAAKELLILRTKNAPPERDEKRWLKGWLARLDRYLS